MQVLMMYSNFGPSDAHCQCVEALLPGRKLVVVKTEEDALAAAAECEVILGHRYLRQVLPHVTNLKWIQTTAAGVDQIVSDDLIRLSPWVTRCPIFSDVIAQHALAMAWAILRRIPKSALLQTQQIWGQGREMLPLPRTALVLGMGSIGQTLGRMLKGLGLRVLGVARTSRDPGARYSDEMLTEQDWKSRLGEVDLLFVCLPLTPATKHLVDQSVFSALPKHAVVVNISRGGTLDTEALRQTLVSGGLGGAALDVMEPQPLPKNHPLWNTPRLLITPHVSVYHPQMQEQLERFVEEQVSRYAAGKTLLHVVSPGFLKESLPEAQ